MLRATFQRLFRGVSASKEAKFWRQGLLSWEDLEKSQAFQADLFDSAGQTQLSLFSILRKALENEDVSYFSKVLDRKEHFRIALEYPNRTVFLDIETTGLSRYYDYITLIGWCYQGRYGALVRGDDETELRRVLNDAKVIVTFNGSLFDLPFLREKLPDLVIPEVHLDLRFLAKRVDLSGGQKAIEGELGFKRPLAVRGMEGEAAPILWHRYRRGSLDALKLLIEYNHSDIEGMKFIFDQVVKRLFKTNGVPKSVRGSAPRFGSLSEIRWDREQSGDPSKAMGIKLEPYRGSIAPAITLDALQKGLSPIRVVGIDLTGSEARPTGWCLLDGADAITQMIDTDERIFDATLKARPHVVSIDSPLSLPKGRTTVFDDDPGRDEFGIMRISERILKKRGINSYPAVILSMQKLTARGIRLADRFRKLGLPVIESYPGAAQDIMGIPRKRASLDMLRDGLAEFGVTGPFRTEQVTHDELDSITSAVVGLFFWAGRFESLGSEEEEALIIPDLVKSPANWLGRRVIGLSGPIAAGKTTAARYIEGQGFHYTRYSMVLQSIMTVTGSRMGRTKLQKFGEEVHRNLGQRWLGRKMLESLPGQGNIVIDGLRFPEDHSFLAEKFGPAFSHIHIHATEHLRRQRFAIREGSDAKFDIAQAQPVEQQTESLRSLANFETLNEASLESLKDRLDDATNTHRLGV